MLRRGLPDPPRRLLARLRPVLLPCVRYLCLWREGLNRLGPNRGFCSCGGGFLQILSSFSTSGAGAPGIFSFTPDQLKGFPSGGRASSSSSSVILTLREEWKEGRVSGSVRLCGGFFLPPAPRAFPPNSLLHPEGFESPPFGDFAWYQAFPASSCGAPLADRSASVSVARRALGGGVHQGL